MVSSLTVSQYGFVPLKLELLNLDFQGLKLDELFWRQRRQFLLKHPPNQPPTVRSNDGPAFIRTEAMVVRVTGSIQAAPYVQPTDRTEILWLRRVVQGKAGTAGWHKVDSGR